MPLVQVIYASSATEIFEKDELIALLETSRANNHAVDVTGILLYKDGNFLQVLEGPEPAVDTLLARIAKDQRHKRVMVFFRQTIENRDFPNWSMAFRDLKDPVLTKLPGFNEFLNLSLADPSLLSDSPRVRQMISVFAKSIR